MTRLCALLCCLALAGCVKTHCYRNTDCPSPQMCSAQGACVFECSTSPECSSGFTCVGHRCQPQPTAQVQCPDDMTVVANLFCIDRYEASREDATGTSAGSQESPARSRAGVLPWQVASNAQAARACEAAGKRLCAPDEWQLACEGPAGTTYGYGSSYDPAVCNGIDTFGRSGFHLLPTGTLAGCTNGWGVLDMNGNLWEHVAGGSDMSVRGGAFNCSDSATLHRCDYVPGNWAPSARGFRCCSGGWVSDAGAPAAPEDAGSKDAAREVGCIDDAAQGPAVDTRGDVPVTSLPDAAPEAPLPDAAPEAPLADADGGVCPPFMAPVGDFCIDMYEASRSDATATSGGSALTASTRAGVLPWQPVTLAQARAGCATMGKRLCRADEWFETCSQAGRNPYVYGPSYEPATCNGIDTYCDCGNPACAGLAACPYPHCFTRPAPGQDSLCGASPHVMPTGSFAGCANAYGVMDVNGNVWELVDSDDGQEHFRGGAFNCIDSELLHRCDYDATWDPSAKGFRCCADRGQP